MLRQLRLTGFKSFVDETIPLAPLTILVGANAAGKSNVLDALLFLQGAALDLTLTDVLRSRRDGGRVTWPGVRGGSSEIVSKGCERATIESTWTLGGEEVTHRLTFLGGDHPLVAQESLKSSAVHPYLFDTEAGALAGRAGLDGANLRVAIKRKGKGNSVTKAFPATRSLLSQIQPGGSVSADVIDRRDKIRQAMRGAYFLDITPTLMRDYAPRGADFVGLSGEKVSSVAHAMCLDEGARRDLVDWLSELCVPELSNIEFSTTELGDVMLVLVEGDGRRIPARSLSDGTLRFLGELIALRSAPRGSLLLMEEIENGLHPTRAHLLVQAMEAAIEARGLQVIATTHSPLVLHALSPTALRETVLVARPAGETGSIARRLGDLPGFDEVVQRRGIDRLLASGWLERAL
jgi:predicted ATPase